MPRKIISVVVRLVAESEKPIDVDEVVSELDYSFRSTTEGVDLIETEIQEVAYTLNV